MLVVEIDEVPSMQERQRCGLSRPATTCQPDAQPRGSPGRLQRTALARDLQAGLLLPRVPALPPPSTTIPPAKDSKSAETSTTSSLSPAGGLSCSATCAGAARSRRYHHPGPPHRPRRRPAAPRTQRRRPGLNKGPARPARQPRRRLRHHDLRPPRPHRRRRPRHHPRPGRPSPPRHIDCRRAVRPFLGVTEARNTRTRATGRRTTACRALNSGPPGTALPFRRHAINADRSQRAGMGRPAPDGPCR